MIKAGAQWEVLAVNSLDDHPFAAPAIVDGRIYIRTSRHFTCFAKPPAPAGVR